MVIEDIILLWANFEVNILFSDSRKRHIQVYMWNLEKRKLLEYIVWLYCAC